MAWGGRQLWKRSRLHGSVTKDAQTLHPAHETHIIDCVKSGTHFLHSCNFTNWGYGVWELGSAPRNCLLPQFSGNLKISLDVSAWRSTCMYLWENLPNFDCNSKPSWFPKITQVHPIAGSHRFANLALLYLLYEWWNLLKNCGFSVAH
jgi:hypothetical protein